MESTPKPEAKPALIPLAPLVPAAVPAPPAPPPPEVMAGVSRKPAIPAPLGRAEDVLAAGAQQAGLELRVEELDRRLRERTLELESETRAKERQRERAVELARRVSELEETAAALHREAVSASALSRELDEALRAAAEARRQLGEALGAEKTRRECVERDLAAMIAAQGETRTRAEETAKAVQEELRWRTEDLREARIQLEATREKLSGQEAHIQSLLALLTRAQEEAGLRAAQEERVHRADSSALEAASDALEAERGRREAAERQLAALSVEQAEIRVRSGDMVRAELRSAAESAGWDSRVESLKAELAQVGGQLDLERSKREGAEKALSEARFQLELLCEKSADRDSRVESLKAELAQAGGRLDLERSKREGAEKVLGETRLQLELLREKICGRDVRVAELGAAAAQGELERSKREAAEKALGEAQLQLEFLREKLAAREERLPQSRPAAVWQSGDESRFFGWIMTAAIVIAAVVASALLFQG